MPTINKIWPAFKALEWFDRKGKDRIAIVDLDRDTDDFAHIIGQEILIDGTLYIGRGVDRYMHSPPWHRGEHIGIVVDDKLE